MSTIREEKLKECGSRKEYIFVPDLSVISRFDLSKEDPHSWSRSSRSVSKCSQHSELNCV